MLLFYLVALIVGGVLLAATLILGGDADTDVDAGGDAEVDAGGGGGGLDALVGWLPFTSLRFWTFFGAFFGLIGTVLSAWKMAGATTTAILAVAGGYVSGLMVDRAIRHLRRSDADSSVGERDVLGASGLVLVPVAAGRTGKVRVHLKGRTLDLLAETEDDGELAAGQRALVLSVREDGHAIVTREGKLDE